MKSAIATVEIFAVVASADFSGRSDSPKRLSLAIGAPERCPSGNGWQCRVVLADLYPAETVVAENSVEALAGAMDRAREWVAELRAQGCSLSRDRAGEFTFEFD